jgi:hypothetical protein
VRVRESESSSSNNRYPVRQRNRHMPFGMINTDTAEQI